MDSSSSDHGTSSDACLKLAALHSEAVDYPKNGWNVDIQDLHRNLISFKSDWHATEAESPRLTDYYECDRALATYIVISCSMTIYPVAFLNSGKSR